MCVPGDRDGTSSTSSGSFAGPAPAAPLCATLTAAGADVAVVTVATAPPALTDATAPDATYTLSQAFVYPSAGNAAPPLATLRATLTITGSLLVLGTQGASSSLEQNESFTTTLSAGVLTLVCKNRTGAVALALLPGAAGEGESAGITYAPSAALLTLRVVRPFGTVDLFFTRT